MYKNLNCDLLGISGRQSEIIELALTYGYKGIDIDMADLVKRCQRGSFESASRFLTSSKLRVGGFQAAVDLDSDDETFTAQAALLNGAAEIAGRAEAQTAVLNIPGQTDRLPYPEYFEVLRKRIDEVSTVFGNEGVRVALAFTAGGEEGESKEFKFIQDVEGFVALVKSCQNVGIVFDSWNWFCGAGTEEHLDRIGNDKIYIARISDCVEGVAAESATLNDCLLPSSTGVIDNSVYLKRFSDAGIDIPVSARGRLEAPGGTRDKLVGKTQDALDQAFATADIPSSTRKPEQFETTGSASE